MSKFTEFVRLVAERPAMYVGQCSLQAVCHYLSGYDHALHDVGHNPTPLEGWLYWVELRFLISNPAWSWTRILLHVYGSDQEAIAALPTLYDEFLNLRSQIGVQGIREECRRRLIAKYGDDDYAPEEI